MAHSAAPQVQQFAKTVEKVVILHFNQPTSITDLPKELEKITPCDQCTKNILEKLKIFVNILINNLRVTKKKPIMYTKKHLLKAFDTFDRQTSQLPQLLPSTISKQDAARWFKETSQAIDRAFSSMSLLAQTSYGIKVRNSNF